MFVRHINTIYLATAVAVVFSCLELDAQTINFEADNDPNDGNGVWESTTANQTTNWSFSGGQSTQATVAPGTPGIARSYQFPSAAATAPTYNANFNTGADATFELWIRPTSLTGQNVLFETGGNGSGAAIQLDGNVLTFTAQSGTANRMLTSAQLVDMPTDVFTQVVGTLDFTGGGAADMNFYVNGQLADSTSIGSGFGSFAGGDASGLGRASPNSIAGIDNDLNGRHVNFDGEIAIHRFYENNALSAADVASNYSDVATRTAEAPTATHEFDNLVFNYNAAAPGSNAGQWQADHLPDAVDADSAVDFNLGGGADTPTFVSVDSENTRITEALEFTGGAGSAVATQTYGNDSGDGAQIGGSNVTIEAWVRPNDLSGQEAIFEAGGDGNGLSLLLDDNQLLFRFDQDSATSLSGNNNLNATATLSDADIEDFMQIIAQVDLDGDKIDLYVNGELEDSQDAGSDINSWVGGNVGAIGSFSGLGLNRGGTDSNDLDSFGALDGLVGTVRIYDTLLDEEQIRGNFAALRPTVIPEPATFAMWLLLGSVVAGFALGRFHANAKASS